MARATLGRALILVVLSYCAPHAHADWTRFRGPNGSGISPDKQSTPVRWSGSANLKWKTKLPGAGVSNPIIVGDRVFVTCYSGYGLDRQDPGDQKNLKRHLVCIDRKSGQTLWSKEVDAVLPEDPYEGIGVTAHGYASSTPVSDGERVYVFFGKTGALAFNLSGKKLWQTSVGTESDPRRWGSASSPILYKDLLIVPAACESEALVALDTKTGKEVWRQEASGLANSWSTPILVEVDENRTDLVIGVTAEIWGLSPETGKLRWYSEGAKSGSFCSSAVSDGDVVYAIEGRSGLSMAIRAGGKGDVSESRVLWKGRDSARFGSPIVHHGRIYSCAGGIASAIDAKTGERITQTRLEGGRGESGGMGGDYASPVLADGKLYYVRKSGDLFVLQADEKLKQLAVNRLTDEVEAFSSTPAVSRGDLFIRSDKNLYCVSAMGQTVKDETVAGSGKSKGDTAGERVARRGGDGGRGARGNRGGRGGRNFDPAEFFKRLDADGDGKLTGDEISERMRGRVAQMDKDKDGSITLEEFRSGMSRGGGRGRGGGGGNPRDGKPKRPQRPESE